MPQHPIGQIVIQRIVESICTAFEPLSFFPETTPDDWARHRTRAFDPVSGNLVLPIQGVSRAHAPAYDFHRGNIRDADDG